MQALYAHLTTASWITPLPNAPSPLLLWPQLEKDIANKSSLLCKFLSWNQISYLFPTLFLVFTSLLLQLLLPLLSNHPTSQALVNTMSKVRRKLTSLPRTHPTLHPVARSPLPSSKPSPPSSMSSTMLRPTPSISKSHSDHPFSYLNMLFHLPCYCYYYYTNWSLLRPPKVIV